MQHDSVPQRLVDVLGLPLREDLPREQPKRGIKECCSEKVRAPEVPVDSEVVVLLDGVFVCCGGRGRGRGKDIGEQKRLGGECAWGTADEVFEPTLDAGVGCVVVRVRGGERGAHY